MHLFVKRLSIFPLALTQVQSKKPKHNAQKAHVGGMETLDHSTRRRYIIDSSVTTASIVSNLLDAASDNTLWAYKTFLYSGIQNDNSLPNLMCNISFHFKNPQIEESITLHPRHFK